MSRPDAGNTDSTEPFSEIEDLDPEPDGSGGRSRVRELVVGVALLLIVVGWALGTSWHDASNLSHYQQGQQAAIDHRWDAALANYSAAKGYKDADARADDAARQIELRDRQYQAAQTTDPAALALQAARAVQTIEPGYKEIDKLAARAEDQVYTDALSGTVVMRTQAQPPGLYYRGPSGWQYLQESDPWSQVLSIPLNAARAKEVVYDVPGPGWTAPAPTSTPTPGPNNFQRSEGSPDKAGRRLVLVRLPQDAGEPAFEALQFDPVEFNNYVSGDKGVWGWHYRPQLTHPVIAKGLQIGSSLSYEEVGQQTAGKAGSTFTTTVAMPGTDGEVADFGHDSDILLLAAHGHGPDNQPDTELYIARADGSATHVVYTTTGVVVSAILSPNDHYALVVDGHVIPNTLGDDEVAAILLTLDGTAPPVTLQKGTFFDVERLTGTSPMLAGALTISGVFLENGAFKNKVLLGWSAGRPPTSATFRLLDVSNPSNSTKVLAEASVPFEGTGYFPVVEQPDGQTLLLYNLGILQTPPVGGQAEVNLQAFHAEQDAGTVTVSSYSVPMPEVDPGSGNPPFFVYPTLRGPNLIYSVQTYLATSDQIDFKVYSVPLTATAGLNKQSPQTRLIYEGHSDPNSFAPAGVAGPGAYAYTGKDGTLHAHLYDADVDVIMEKGTDTRPSLNLNDPYKVLR